MATKIDECRSEASRAPAAHSIVTFMHRFPATPVRTAHDALAVRHGLNVYPVVSYEGRNCYATSVQRVWGGKGRGYYNSYSVHFLDGSIEQIPAGRFNIRARAALTKAESA